MFKNRVGKIMKYIILLSILLIGCETLTQQGIENERALIKTELSYYKDTRTGLCFAGLGVGGPAQTITNVPCTPEVEKLIK